MSNKMKLVGVKIDRFASVFGKSSRSELKYSVDEKLEPKIDFQIIETEPNRNRIFGVGFG